mgnify:CR=1 FL=1
MIQTMFTTWSLGVEYLAEGKARRSDRRLQRNPSTRNQTMYWVCINYPLAYVKKGQPGEATAPLRQLLALDPKHLYASQLLGLAYVQLGEKTAAMQQYYVLKELNARMAAELLKE